MRLQSCRSARAPLPVAISAAMAINKDFAIRAVMRIGRDIYHDLLVTKA